MSKNRKRKSRKLASAWITASEAKALMGITSSFFRYVSEGRVRSKTDTGNGHRLYSRRSVERLMDELSHDQRSKQFAGSCLEPKDLIAYRKDNNMSQTALANKLGVSRSCVCRWENGSRTIPNNVAEELGLMCA